MQLRHGRPEEAAALTEMALRSKAHWGYDEAFIAACRDELTVHPGDMRDRRTVVAEEGGRLLGFTALSGEPPEGALAMMFVEPDTIGQGVGRRLFEHTMAQARRLGFDALTIDADPNAASFYTAMGAARVGATPSGSIPGRELPLLRIALAPVS
ncbi:GNAT family N-acetyltransferase [Streptomyces sp. NPDC002911]